MKDGFIKVAAACPDIKVGDVKYNLDSCIKEARKYAALGARVVAFPRLCLTSASCGDMFFNSQLLSYAEEALAEFVRRTVLLDSLFVVGVPVAEGASLYDCAAIVKGGRLLALVPLDSHAPFSGVCDVTEISFAGSCVPMKKNAVLEANMPRGLRIAVSSDAFSAACTDATLVIVPAAEAEGIGFAEQRRTFVANAACRFITNIIFANAGAGESTSECVYSGDSLIADALGAVRYREPFSSSDLCMTVDIEATLNKRRKARLSSDAKDCAFSVQVDFNETETELPYYSRFPFVPENEAERSAALRRAFEIQAQGLASRFERSYSKTMVLGISGGLDSTLALLVMARAADILAERGVRIGRAAISAVTMPCFGTTERTKSNAEQLAELLGASVRCIDIKASVSRHFEDIGHDAGNYNVVYENAQARERTQVLMDIANAEGGLVVGTGDLSEAALGWATYNGDHMSMYGVNASLPKTLVRAVVENYAEECGDERIAAILRDILATPVSPELLPPKDGEIAQCTEGIVGPYELHDFFIYHFVREGTSPEKLLRIAIHAFDGVYDAETVKGWCEVFLRRFISQQFKRSCTPDAPSVGTVSLSPRGAWQMPSDFSGALFRLGEEK